MKNFTITVRTLAEVSAHFDIKAESRAAALKAAKNKVEQLNDETLEELGWSATYFPYEHRPRVVQVWGDEDNMSCESGL